MTDAPAHRIWPPVALGVPLLAGVLVTAVAGDPFAPAPDVARVVGAILVVVFAIWTDGRSRYLSGKFGGEYDHYRRRVRRRL